MRRWILSVVGLGLAINFAAADYLLILVNVAPDQPKQTMPNGPRPGMMGATGVPPGQMTGRPMGPGIGMAGATGVPPMGMAGAAGAYGMMGYQGTPGQPAGGSKPVYMTFCIEIPRGIGDKDEFVLKNSPSVPTSLLHPWKGIVHLLSSTGPVVKVWVYRDLTVGGDGKRLPRTSVRFEKMKKTEGKGNTDHTLMLAEWALSHGMQAEFEKMMDDLAKEEKNNPIVLTYQKVKSDLAKRVERLPSGPWFERLRQVGKFDPSPDNRSSHYTVLHHLDKDKAVLTSRVDYLEKNLKGFYYWWALRGLALPMPRERLVTVLTNDDYEFKKSCKGLSSASIVYDGFHSPRENVLGLALRPLGESYTQLKMFSDPLFVEPATFDVMLRGLPKAQISKPEQIQASILAMCLKSLEDSLEKAAIGHNGSRQLLYATGLLPPHVLVPSWVEHGMSSIFETPPGQPWETLGAPHPVYLPLVRELKKDRKLEAADVDTLRQVVTDGYFRQASTNPKDKDALLKAKATAWLVCYHLARKQPAKLLTYFKELEKLPPDLDLDEDVLMNCFARAFGVWDGNQKKLDEDGLRRLTASAISDLSTLEMEGDRLLHVYTHFAQIVSDAMSAKPGQPTAPGTRPGGN